jgi:5-methylcytosine-specific restriction protein B
MVAAVVGTQGLSPDEAILGRPGHARKIQAICAWLNRQYGKGQQVAWAKQDPTRVDLDVPDSVRRLWAPYQKIFERYGKVIYGAFTPTGDPEDTATAVAALLDVMFEERGQKPLARFTEHSEALQTAWFEHLMTSATRVQVTELLDRRRYVILQGPPGTGKTLMAGYILRDEYASFGRSIQFHPNMTYENFIGGLAPVHGSSSLGFQFAPTPGFLMQAAAAALSDPSRKYLLCIDEINRADLSKILGEAIYLLEAEPGFERRIELPYDFGKPFHRTLFLPSNLHILGTMNTADRSIAMVDVAVRRRFAFLSLWPSMQVVEQFGCPLTQKAFRDLISIFVEHASDDTLSLVPGHSYFLATEDSAARSNLRTGLAPLLEEYLAQGYVTGFAESIRSYLQWLGSL